MPEDTMLDTRKQAQSNYVNYLQTKIKTEKDPSAAADYKKQLEGATKSLAKYDKKAVIGPGGKEYWFSKNISQARIDKYFTKQGWVKKGNDWFTQTGEPARLGVGSGTPKINLRTPMPTGVNKKETNAALEAGVAALPTTMATGFSIAGGTKKTPTGMGMAALGGAAGYAAKDLASRVLFSRSAEGIPTGAPRDTTSETIKGIFKEAVIQGSLEGGGRLAGHVFFSILNKIPHAKIVDGIPMLPSDMNPSSRIRKYAEDLLSNLLPSAKTMQAFKEGQTKAVENRLDLLVGGLSRFKGTSEQMGILLQDAVRGAEADAKNNIKNIVKQQGIKTQADMEKLPEYKEYIKTFRDRLVSRIAKEDKPELIAGYLRTDASGLEQIRTLQKAIQEKNPKTWSNVQTKLMQDMISEAFTGAKDPTAKGGTYVKELYSGKDFKSILDKVGEEKLKVIFGQDHYDNIENFIQLTSHLGGSSQAGVGKFLNLMFLLPLRTGITPKGMTHMGITAGVVNRAAKVITSTEGMRLYENYIRAVGQNTPRAIKLATDEISAFNHRTDLELEQEHKENVEKFKQANPNYKEQN